jgi:hypothetical protein
MRPRMLRRDRGMIRILEESQATGTQAGSYRAIE